MTDKELIEQAAKAAGFPLHVWGSPGSENFVDMSKPPGQGRWNPLTDDGDALRLAAALRIDCEFTETAAGSRDFCYVELYEKHDGDRLAAVRRAIVRAAAAIAG